MLGQYGHPVEVPGAFKRQQELIELPLPFCIIPACRQRIRHALQPGTVAGGGKGAQFRPQQHGACAGIVRGLRQQRIQFRQYLRQVATQNGTHLQGQRAKPGLAALLSGQCFEGLENFFRHGLFLHGITARCRPVKAADAPMQLDQGNVAPELGVCAGRTQMPGRHLGVLAQAGQTQMRAGRIGIPGRGGHKGVGHLFEMLAVGFGGMLRVHRFGDRPAQLGQRGGNAGMQMRSAPEALDFGAGFPRQIRTDQRDNVMIVERRHIDRQLFTALLAKLPVLDDRRLVLLIGIGELGIDEARQHAQILAHDFVAVRQNAAQQGVGQKAVRNQFAEALAGLHGADALTATALQQRKCFFRRHCCQRRTQRLAGYGGQLANLAAAHGKQGQLSFSKFTYRVFGAIRQGFHQAQKAPFGAGEIAPRLGNVTQTEPAALHDSGIEDPHRRGLETGFGTIQPFHPLPVIRSGFGQTKHGPGAPVPERRLGVVDVVPDIGAVEALQRGFVLAGGAFQCSYLVTATVLKQFRGGHQMLEHPGIDAQFPRPRHQLPQYARGAQIVRRRQGFRGLVERLAQFSFEHGDPLTCSGIGCGSLQFRQIGGDGEEPDTAHQDSAGDHSHH